MFAHKCIYGDNSDINTKIQISLHVPVFLVGAFRTKKQFPKGNNRNANLFGLI